MALSKPDPPAGELTMRKFAISGLSAGLAHMACHPLYTLRSQMMYHQRKFLFNTFLKESFRNPRGFLYRGLVARSIGIMPEKGMKMRAYKIFSDDKLEGVSKYSNCLLAGAMAGAATTVIGCPSERLMVYAQLHKGQVWKKIGFKGVYEGWTATLYRDIVFNMLFFTVREGCVDWYKHNMENDDPQPGVRLLLGLPGGILGAIFGCPFDVIKTKMQGKQLDEPYKSCFKHYREIVQQETHRGLMKGLMPRLISVPIMMSLFYVINEELEKVFA